MELIVIREKKKAGKTTTAAIVNNTLVQEKNANPIGIWLKEKLAPLDGANDFVSVLELNKKIIVIISSNDYQYLKTEINELKNVFQPAIMVICAWFGGNNPTMKMLQEKYKDLYDDMHSKNHQIILRYIKDKGKEKVDNKPEERCIDLISKMINIK